MKKFLFVIFTIVILGTNAASAQKTYGSTTNTTKPIKGQNTGNTDRPIVPSKLPSKNEKSDVKNPSQIGTQVPRDEDLGPEPIENFDVQKGPEGIYDYLNNEHHANVAAKVWVDFFPCNKCTVSEAENFTKKEIVIGCGLDGGDKKLLANREDAAADRQTQVALKFQVNAVDTSLANIKGSILDINRNGSFKCKTVKGKPLCNGNFSRPDSDGFCWGFATYNGKKIAIKFNWEPCTIDARGNISELITK